MAFPTSGQADRFLDFLEKELIPHIDRNYRTYPHRIIAGWSFGGLLATHALIHRPEIFDAYLAISPSLWWDEELLLAEASLSAG